MQIDHVETWRVRPPPTDPGRSICDLDFYIPDEPATVSSEHHWEKNWRLTIDTVIDEDLAAMAGVQRGLESGAIDAIRVGANEPALGFFHAALHEAIDESSGGSAPTRAAVGAAHRDAVGREPEIDGGREVAPRRRRW